MSFGIPNARFKFRMPTGNNGQQTPVWNAGSIQSVNIDKTDSLQNGCQLVYNSVNNLWVPSRSNPVPYYASSGSCATPSYSFEGSTGTGMALVGPNMLGLSAGGQCNIETSATGMNVFTRIMSVTGSSGAPSYSFQSDPTTGIYLGGPSDMRFSAGGVYLFQMTDEWAYSARTMYGITGTTTLPSFASYEDDDTGIYFLGSNTLGFTTGGIRQLSLNDTEHILWTGPNATATALRFTTSSNITYIQNSGPFDKTSTTPTASTFQTIRFSPYSSTTSLFDITSGGVYAPTGTNSAPSYSYSADNTTGMYLPDSGVLGFSTGGVERLRLDATGVRATEPLIQPYDYGTGTDSGIVIPDKTVVFKIVAGTETAPFALTGPTGVAGQVLYVRNDSGQATTGLVVPSTSGAVFAHDGASFLKMG